uniref:Putative secreted protein n=1 Tax=Ixodes ricinus TaxID=34613 RepID=A0A6B0UDM7_IXORI
MPWSWADLARTSTLRTRWPLPLSFPLISSASWPWTPSGVGGRTRSSCSWEPWLLSSWDFSARVRYGASWSCLPCVPCRSPEVGTSLTSSHPRSSLL